MWTPYRRPGAVDESPALDRRDDTILGALLIALSSWRVVLAIATGEDFGFEATGALIMSCLGLLLVANSFSRRA